MWVGEPELPLDHSGHKLSLQRIEGERTGPSGGRGGLRACVCVCGSVCVCVCDHQSLFFLWTTKNSCRGNSPCMLHPLMSWCVSGSGWTFCCSVAVEESCVHPRIHPVSSVYASFYSRWDEFGQNRRGSESTAAPRRGPRVSFTENFQQQSRNFRELKQRVFRHRAGRYTSQSAALSNSFPSSECNPTVFVRLLQRWSLFLTLHANAQRRDDFAVNLFAFVFVHPFCNDHLFPCHAREQNLSKSISS